MLDGLKSSLIPAMKDLERFDDSGGGRGREKVKEMMLPWVQGIQDDEYKSPSQSFSGSALDELRHRKSSRSPSPCSPEKDARGGDDVLVEPTQDLLRQDDIKAHVTPSYPPKKCIKDYMDMKNAKHNESPDDEFAIKRLGADVVDDILAGLEDSVNTAEKETPKTMLMPKSSPSTVDSDKENENGGRQRNETQDRQEGKEKTKAPKTVTRARASRRAIEQAQTPHHDTPSSEEKRRIPARLLPWSCIACTFDNKGSSISCEMCGQAKGSDTLHPSPNTIAQQESIASQAKLSSTKKRRKIGMANESHMIESTPLEGRSLHEKHSDEVRDTHVLDSGIVEDKQATLTGNQGKKRLLKRKDSRLVQVSSKIEPKRSKCNVDQACLSLKAVVATASNLNEEDKSTLKSFCNTSGPIYSSNWSSKVTHVICPESTDPAKTFKYLMALLTGAHIVSMHWVSTCIQSGTCEPEEQYSLYPLNWRRNRAISRGYPELLSGYEIQLQPVSKGSNARNATDLLKAAGAKVVNRLPRIDGDKRGIILVLDQGEKEPLDESTIVQQPWFGRACGAGIPVVKQAWLRTSIIHRTPASVQEFTI